MKTKHKIKDVVLELRYRDSRGSPRKRSIKLGRATNISVKGYYTLEETRQIEFDIEFDNNQIAEFFEVADALEGKLKVPEHIHKKGVECKVCKKIDKALAR